MRDILKYAAIPIVFVLIILHYIITKTGERLFGWFFKEEV